MQRLLQVMTNKITGTIEILEHSWTWKSDKNLGVDDIEFIDKVNPNFSIVFKNHILGGQGVREA